VHKLGRWATYFRD